MSAPVRYLEKVCADWSGPNRTVRFDSASHPNDHVLYKILNSMKIPIHKHDTTFCDAYKKGKMHKLPFYSHPISVKNSLEIIYSDLWGPSPYSSTEGHH